MASYYVITDENGIDIPVEDEVTIEGDTIEDEIIIEGHEVEDLEEHTVSLNDEVVDTEDGTQHAIVVSGNFGEIQMGETFTSYEEFRCRLEEHKQLTSTEYWVRDCRTLQKAAGNVPRSLKANPELKYYYIKLHCKYGGQNFKSKSTNKRKFSGTFRQGCEAKILVSLSEDCMHLVVKHINNEHNHVCSKKELRVRPGSQSKVPRLQHDDKLDGLKRFGKYIVHGGFLYRSVKSSRHEKKLYLVCANVDCVGRAYRIIGNDVVQAKAHNHFPDSLLLDRLKFEESLRTRAQKESIPIQRIYEQESEKYPAICETFDKYKETMLESRRSTLPEAPKALQELGYLLVSEDWYNRFGCNLEDPPRDLFIGAVRGKGKEISAVFASLFFCELMNTDVEEIYIDASYSNLPNKPFDIKYLLTIHVNINENSYPAIYALMSSRNVSAILSVLKFVKDEVLSQCSPKRIYTSFEAEMHIACREVFPEAKIEGTAFHFIKDVWEQCKSLKLITAENKESMLLYVKMCMALSFLHPSLIQSGLNAISASVVKADRIISPIIQLIQHIRYSWLEAVGVNDISCIVNPRRSNRSALNFQVEFDSHAVKKEHNIWRFIGIIQKMEANHRFNYQCFSEGNVIEDIRRCTYFTDDSVLEEATKHLDEGRIGILEFLTTLSPLVDPVTMDHVTFDTIGSLSDEEKITADNSDNE